MSKDHHPKPSKFFARSLSPDPKDASTFTIEANQKLLTELDFSNEDDFADAGGHLEAPWPPPCEIKDQEGSVLWTLEPYNDQMFGTPPPLTVNPSLWRQAQLNRTNGLFKVTEGIYQVRAFDMSNMTIIEGASGLIIIDPLISCECARDALQLYRTRFNSDAPIKAVIFTHSHIDHFGGVLGVITPQDVLNGVQVIAPEGFLEHAVSENIYAGIAMSRRAQYMYGPYLTKGPKGQVDGGLGKGQSVGQVSIVKPTLTLGPEDQELTIDGVRIQFHQTPGGEAPAEFDFYFPDHQAFCAAENAAHTMHNIQTLRGARVRDALLWSKYLNEALDKVGSTAKVLFASHHWPVWDESNGTTGNVARFLTSQRDMYRYLNDQTLRMLNKGYTGVEIAEVFTMPPPVDKIWSCRGYYGSVNHNVKAVYDRYMGWFDGNPSNLHSLPPQMSSPKYVELMGGADQVLIAADTAYKAGDYRWAAELLNKLIFADPNNANAKLLQADVLEQLGYQAEAATWRNFYLMGAQELRVGVPDPSMSTGDPSMVKEMTEEMIFDAIAAQLNGPMASEYGPIVMNWIFDEAPQRLYLVEVSSGAMSTTADKQNPGANVNITLKRSTLDSLICREITWQEALDSGEVQVDNPEILAQFWSFVDQGVPNFAIVTPRGDIQADWVGSTPSSKKAMTRKLQILGRIPRGC